MTIRTASPILLLLIIAGCATETHRPDLPNWHDPSVRAAMVDPDFIKADRTYAYYEGMHGIQIEYIAPDGRTYLWYPGNRDVVAGQWMTRTYHYSDGVAEAVCYRYGANTYNPVTQESGGDWNCQPTATSAAEVVSFADGDPFGLAKGGLPDFDLSGCDLPAPLRPMKGKTTC